MRAWFIAHRSPKPMGHLAISGGTPVRTASWPCWPLVEQQDVERVTAVVTSGVWGYNGPQERRFAREFANFIGTDYAIPVANDTVSLQTALEALGIGYGDEVIVPGLTWQATASVCLDVNAIPILVDVEPDSWCIDPQRIEDAITERSKAVIIVHLYGSNPRMEAILDIVKRHQLFLIEDCAHQHGTIINGKKVGAWGDIGSFSFQQSKVLTAGEGGAVTTNNRALAQKLDALRNCGRKPRSLISEAAPVEQSNDGFYQDVGNFIHSGNFRLTEFQAALLSCQLARLDAQLHTRDENAQYLNQRLAEIPGITPMRRDPGVSLQSYFNLAFRYDAQHFRHLPVQTFRQALVAELGCSVEPCYEPLNECQLYRPLTKARYKLNPEYIVSIDPARFSLPVCKRAYACESVNLHHRVLLATRADMDEIVKAIRKIQRYCSELL